MPAESMPPESMPPESMPAESMPPESTAAQWSEGEPLLAGLPVVSLAVNLPGPAAAARLVALGAQVTKVEPPAGDFLAAAAPAYYAELAAGQRVVTIDLKTPDGLAELAGLLDDADLLLTSSRPAALARLGLDWASVHARWPLLCQVAIVGHSGAEADVPGHDLTYQARVGVLLPPAMPTVLVADLAGAERAVADALATLLARARTGTGHRREVALGETAQDFARPAQHGLTTPGALLAGALPRYSLYASADGYVAVAALEEHFWEALLRELGTGGSRAELAAAFAAGTSAHWQDWARGRGLPIAAVVAATA